MTFSHWLRSRRSSRTTNRKSRRARQPLAGRKLFLEILEERTVLSPYLVTTTADTGPGSLRDAITQVNADTSHTLYTSPSNSSVDEIDFNITAASDTGGGFNATTGVAAIAPLSELPSITNAVLINGYSQSGASRNTLTNGDNAVLRIVLNGANVPGTDYIASAGLVLNASSSTVQGLAINNFGGSDIYATGNNDNFQGNFIGTDVSGTSTPFVPNLAQNGASDHAGIQITGSSNVIGTNGDGVNDPAERNIIAGNNYGVILRTTLNSVVAGNFIGTDTTGAHALSNWVGIGILSIANGDRIGTNGTDADALGERNIISGNAGGIAFGVGNPAPAESNGLVAGNWIGLDANGNPLGNTRAGIFVGLGSSTITIGGNQPVLANTIANTQSGPGVWIVDFRGAPSGIRIQGNSIHDNGGLGIDLGGVYPTPGPDGVTANDSQTHVGPNNFQDFPTLSAASSSGTSTLISGSFTEAAEPNTTLTLDFYANATGGATTYGQGQIYLGSRTVVTDGSGNASFNAAFAVGNLAGDWISATATDSQGNTSEFSQDIQATSAPSQTFTQSLPSALPQSTTSTNTLTIQANTATINDVVTALSQGNLGSSVVPVSVYLNLAPGTYTPTTVQIPIGMTLYINGVPGTTIDPASPAFTVTSGNVVVSGVTFVTTGDAPTILVTGGSLTLRNCVVQESSSFTDAAISVTGGTLDLGTAVSPGGNVLNVNGAGRFLDNTTLTQVPAVGDTFEINGTVVTPAPYVVTNTTDSGPGSLRDAIAQVNADSLHVLYTSPSDPTRDEIDFNIPGLSNSTPGTITLGGTKLLLTNSVIINGPGADLLAVSGNNYSSVFAVAAGTTATISRLTVENGYIPLGAIVNLGTLTVNDCAISRNAITGIYNGGTMIVSGCTIADNTGEGIVNAGTMTVIGCALTSTLTRDNGAGIENGGTMTVTGCTLSGNAFAEIYNGGNFSVMTVSNCTLSGQRGAGIINGRGSLAVDNCTLSGNAFGGIRNSYGSVTISDCTLSGNGRGGVYNDGGTVTVIGSTLSGNGGGAIYNQADLTGNNVATGGVMTVSDCTLLNNGGGGIDNQTTSVGGFWVVPTMVVSGCTLSGNSGGSAITNNGLMTLINSALVGNFTGGDGGGINNGGTMSVNGCTLSGNTTTDFGGGIFNGGLLTLSGCTVSGNFAGGSSGGGYGGGIYGGLGTLTLNGCTLSGNSALVSGGGIFDGSLASLTIGVNSVVSGNQAPSGADLENLGTLNISHSAVPSLDNQNPGATTINIATTDSATGLIASLDPSSGQIVFKVQVLAAQAGAGTPTGMVTLYDGSNNQLGTATLDASSQAVFTAPGILGSQPPIHAVYSGDANFTSSSSAPLIQTVDALSPANLQTIVSSLPPTGPTWFAGLGIVLGSATTAVSLHADPTSVQDAINAIENLTSSSPVTVVLDLASGKYSGQTISVPANVTLVINGTTTNSLPTTLDPGVPALVLTSGNLVVTNVTLTESGAAPTILVSGGHLMLRNEVVQESTGYNEPAIEITGGTLDLGTAASPGGNMINVNGAGQLVQRVGLNFVSSLGNAFEVNGAPVFPANTTALTSSVNPSLLNQPVTFTATVSAAQSGSPAPTGTVTFVDTTTGATLGTAAVSGGKAQWTTTVLPVNAQTIAAFYNGDAIYITSAATLIQQVHSHFGGFLSPLNSNLAMALNRTVPIKFQLTDYNNKYTSSLTAVVSLQVLNASGTNVLTNAGSTALRYDSTANQFIANWNTKGLPAGTYKVTLVLADGTTYTKSVTLSKNGSSAGLVAAGDGTETTATGVLLGGDITLYVDNTNGDLTADELARIQDAVTAVDGLTEPYGVAVQEVTDPTLADVTLNMDTTSAVGGYADSVLGCTTDAGLITIINGWNFYAGNDVTQIGSSQYDFETVVTHELGHALGLGHNSDSTSVMYATLSTGTVNRCLAAADLNVADSDTSGACGLHAAAVAGRVSDPSYKDSRDALFTMLAANLPGALLPTGREASLAGGLVRGPADPIGTLVAELSLQAAAGALTGVRHFPDSAYQDGRVASAARRGDAALIDDLLTDVAAADAFLV